MEQYCDPVHRTNLDILEWLQIKLILVVRPSQNA
jgi:hypothetical protein